MLSTPLVLTGCVHTTVSSDPSHVLDVACQAFQPITWSKQDTDDTLRQIKAHNAVYLTLCGSVTRPSESAVSER
jgi:hypothetical protein